jgi:hypothetical protein
MKQQFRTLFLRAGVQEGPEVEAADYGCIREGGVEVMMPCDRLTPKEIQVATLLWEGLTHHGIGKRMRTTEQVVRITCAAVSTNWECGAGSSWLCTCPHGGKTWLEDAMK